MATAHERTPLLGPRSDREGGNQHARSIPADHTGRYLEAQSKRLIGQIKPHHRDLPLIRPLDTTTLVVHLYAVYVLRRPTVHRKRGVRARLVESQSRKRSRAVLDERIRSLLDHLESLEESSYDGDDDELLQLTFWARWRISDKITASLNALDLLLPPYATHGETSPYVAHPVVRHMINHTWNHGLSHTHQQQPEPAWLRLFRKLADQTLPRRLHALHLCSFLALYALTLSVALAPGTLNDTPPWELGDMAWREIIWLVWTGADLIGSLQGVSLVQRILLQPTHLAFLMALLPNTRYLTYSLIVISIPTLAFLLILPTPPSAPIAFRSLLPLSVLLQKILRRSTNSAGLLLPLVLVLFAIFSWSMNGDIFRGFFTLSRAGTTATALKPATQTEEPIEPGISPYAARLSLFLTLTLLLVLSIVLTSARATIASQESGDLTHDDDLEREYGLLLGREARGAWTAAVRHYVSYEGDSFVKATPGPEEQNEAGLPGYEDAASSRVQTKQECPALRSDTPVPPFVPAPFNLIVLLPDLVAWVTTVTPWSARAQEMRYHLRAGLAGLLCLPFAAFGRGHT